MRILIADTTGLETVRGGMARAIETLFVGLGALGHEVFRFVPGPWNLRELRSVSRWGGREYRLGVVLPFAGSSRVRSWAAWAVRTPGTVLRIRRLLRTKRIDLTHCTFHSVNFVFPVLKQLFGFPYVVTLHGSDAIYFGDIPAGHRWFARMVLRGADAVIAVSENVATAATALVGSAQEVHLIYNGIDVERVRETGGRARLPKCFQSRYVVAVGGLSRVKGFDVLIEAWTYIQRNPGTKIWKLVIVGDGPEAEHLKRLAADAGVGDTIAWPGWLPWEEVLGIVGKADLFVMPSRSEGLPYALLEAGALAVPVVASGVGAIPEVLRPPEGGLTVPPEDPVALSNALLKMLLDQPSRVAAGSNLRNRVETVFSVKCMAESHAQIYSKVIAQA